MKQYAIATAALVALTAQAQVSGPNRPGPGKSPGTFQQPSTTSPSTRAIPGSVTSVPSPGEATASTVDDGIQPPFPESAPVVEDTFQTQPQPGALNRDPLASPRTGVLPNNRIGTLDPIRGAETDSLRARSAFPNSRDWEANAGAPPAGATGSDSSRLTPRPDINPQPRPLGGAASSTAVPTAPVPSDLNTTSVNTPARTVEQPLDRALSAKIRSQLSQDPVGATPPTARISPENVRDLRITSQGGRIVLEGTVNNEKEKEAIEMRARAVQGVAGIDNRIRVKTQNSGAPAVGQSGQSQSAQPDVKAGQSKQNSSDLDDSHPELTPDK